MIEFAGNWKRLGSSVQSNKLSLHLFKRLHRHRLQSRRIDFELRKNETAYACAAVEATDESKQRFLNSSAAYRLTVPLALLTRKGDVEFLRTFDVSWPRYEQHSVLVEKQDKRYLDCRHYCLPSPVVDMRVDRLVRMLMPSWVVGE